MKKQLFCAFAASALLALAACNNYSSENPPPKTPEYNITCEIGFDLSEDGLSCVGAPSGQNTCPEGYELKDGQCVGGSSSSSSERALLPAENFTETVGNASFDMVYIPGGAFTIGCEESSGCPDNTAPVEGVKVSSYFIGKTEVSTGLWNAVMGGNACPQYQPNCGANSYTNMTWYDAMEFACKLSQMTGKNYRMTTEAEWEYAAKNHIGSLEKVGTGEEWAYNSWSGTHMGGTDPVGPGSGSHTQKTRRDAQGAGDNITARLIRSIEGVGPALRLAVSAGTDFPPSYVPPCNLHAPVTGEEPANSYRDPRWVTGSSAKWTKDTATTAIGNFELRTWEDGTATMTASNYMGGQTVTTGQWFTSNNIALVFVPNSGTIRKYAYIFLNETLGSLISDQDFMSNGFVGRIVKEEASNVEKPTVPGLKSGAELAAAAGDDYKMVDMANIPATAKKQDARLLDGTDYGWFQDNSGPGIGGVHHYRKDIDPDEFRFTVNQNNRTMLANGSWFTVNNTFLRVTHSTGYTADYLYAVTSDGTFYHNSFMAYERGDFRIFKKVSNSDYAFPESCGSHCSSEIPKSEPVSFYANMGETGKSTFKPAPCPSGGCK